MVKQDKKKKKKLGKISPNQFCQNGNKYRYVLKNIYSIGPGTGELQLQTSQFWLICKRKDWGKTIFM